MEGPSKRLRKILSDGKHSLDKALFIEDYEALETSLMQLADMREPPVDGLACSV